MTWGTEEWSQKNFSVHVIMKEPDVGINLRSGLEIIKLFSCSTQLRLKFILLAIVGILTFKSRINYRLW